MLRLRSRKLDLSRHFFVKNSFTFFTIPKNCNGIWCNNKTQPEETQMKLLLIIATMIAAASAQAADPIKINGNLATSWSSLSGGRTGANNSKVTNAQDSAFSFDQMRFMFTGGTETVSYYARVSNVLPNEGLGFDIANVTYKKDMGMFTFGRLDNFAGMESTTYGKNATYTTGYVTELILNNKKTDGVKYGHDFGAVKGAFILGNHVMDNAVTDDNKRLYAGVSVTGKAVNDALTWFVSYETGDEGAATLTKHTYTNVWGKYALNEQVDLALEYGIHAAKPDSGDSVDKNGLSLTGSYKWDMHAFALRYEALAANNDNEVITGAKKLTSITLADKIKLDENLLAVIEYRMDGADEKVFADNKGKAQKSGNVITLGLAATF